VTFVYRGHIGRTSSKLITRIISLGSSLVDATTSAIYSKGTPLKFGWNRGGVVLSRKPALSLKRGKIGPKLLLITNRKSRFRLVPKSTTLDDLEGPLRTVFQKTCLSEPTTKIWMKIGPNCRRRRCSPMTLDSGNIRLVRIFAVVPRRGGRHATVG